MNTPRLSQSLPLAVLLTLAACGSEPSSTPPPGPPADASQSPADLGAVDAPPLPCNGACGPGTVCEGGRCVLADAGAPVDVSPGLDARPLEDLGADREAPVDVQLDAPPPPPDAGPCGMCSYPNARAECSPSGACSLVGCLPGFGDCDGRNANGCEQSLNEAANCGACNMRCPSGVQCIDGRCGCAAGQTLCGATCINTASDRMNCGRCGNACPGVQSCYDGVCCVVGRASCDGNAANGCETDVATEFRCGGCAVRCTGSQLCAPVPFAPGYVCR